MYIQYYISGYHQFRFFSDDGVERPSLRQVFQNGQNGK